MPATVEEFYAAYMDWTEERLRINHDHRRRDGELVKSSSQARDFF
jgi:hypothetical protein